VLKSVAIDGFEQGYPSVNKDLIRGIRNRTKEFTGVSVDDSAVVITNGCGGAFGVLSIALSQSSVGIETPFYSPAYEYFRRTGDMWYVRCTPELDWAIDFDLLRKELEQRNHPGTLFLVSPSNPTGHVHSEDDWKTLVDLAGEFDQILITDEVYDEMSHVPFTSLLRVSKDVPVIYMHGFSKVWRAPEIRVGYLILHDPADKARELFDNIQQVAALGFGVNPISQMIASKLLNEDVGYRKKQFDEVRSRRDVLVRAIDKSGNLRAVPAGGATHQMIGAPCNDWETCTRLVHEHSILVTPASAHDPFIGDRYIRVAFLNTPETLKLLVEVLDSLS
jgi:aspartate/methionine/tyrosine aminotransferase